MMRRTPHHTGWAGALAVAAELSRRSYDVTITLGNTPAVDLLCCSPSGKTFKIQVKSLSRPNWIFIRSSVFDLAPDDDLFLAVVLVPEEPAKTFEYHLLKHAEACALHKQYPQVRKDGRPYASGVDGLGWAEIRPHRDQWNKLPK